MWEPLQSSTESSNMHGKMMMLRMTMAGVSIVVIAIIAIITVTEAI